jgi:hypothetical protein
VEWERRLARDGAFADFGDFGLVYHVGVRPIVPEEYHVDGIVALTFRLRRRAHGNHDYATTIDLGAALRLGARMGLDAGEALAHVDSHERIHVALQLEGVEEHAEEAQANVVDAVVLSLRHEAIARHLRHGDFGVVTKVEPGFWEALVDLGKPGTP